MTPRVKICGICSIADARAAVEAGADAIGLMFYSKSPRYVSWDLAASILAEIPVFVTAVGVWVNPDRDDVRRGLDLGINAIQLHGDEPPEFCRAFEPARVIKAFRVHGHDALVTARGYPAQTWLLDSFVPGQLGGTGAVFNWSIASEAVREHRNVILAGGLTPTNVAGAVRQVQPMGVDVSSGVESAPGRKDPVKMREFVAAVRGSRGNASQAVNSPP